MLYAVYNYLESNYGGSSMKLGVSTSGEAAVLLGANYDAYSLYMISRSV